MGLDILRTMMIFSLCMILCVASAGTASFLYQKSIVPELTKQTLQNALTVKKPIFVVFYAPVRFLYNHKHVIYAHIFYYYFFLFAVVWALSAICTRIYCPSSTTQQVEIGHSLWSCQLCGREVSYYATNGIHCICYVLWAMLFRLVVTYLSIHPSISIYIYICYVHYRYHVTLYVYTAYCIYAFWLPFPGICVRNTASAAIPLSLLEDLLKVVAIIHYYECNSLQCFSFFHMLVTYRYCLQVWLRQVNSA
jgi:hypothetical protein